jgi:very-short-patch-repair endonuclease
MADIDRARTLRAKPTWAEKLMWRWLRDRRFSAYKFRRQFTIGQYYLDFYCREAGLSIGLDGSGHGHPERQAHDAVRTKFLSSMGIKELRFWNSQLRREPQVVRDAIFLALQERAPHSLPDYTKPMTPGGETSWFLRSPSP